MAQQGSFLPILLHPPRSTAISERDVIFNALRTASLAKITGSAVLEHAKKAAMTKLVQPGAEVVEEQQSADAQQLAVQFSLAARTSTAVPDPALQATPAPVCVWRHDCSTDM